MKVNLKELIEELEFELDDAKIFHYDGITLSKETLEKVISELKQLENIYQQ
jgi:hypothetical protein